jgi:N-carbamoylputrescine amidase
MNARTLNLAAVQLESANNRVTENLVRAERLVEEVARHKADLALLPELFSTGYDINANMWGSAESQGGPTESWLSASGRCHGFHVGGSYLECRDGHYFNTFALAGPSGDIVGRVRKSHPCSFEAYLFEGGDDHHVIDTSIGRIGVAICYDAFIRTVWDDILAGAPDIVLIPMSVPTPSQTLLYGNRRIQAFHDSFTSIAVDRAAAMGVPMAMANKWGPWETTPPGVLPRLLWPRMKTRFPGFTHVADGDGREVARVQEGEGIALATVHLVASRRQAAVGVEQDRFRPWIADVPSEYGAFRYFEALGRRWYAKHSARCTRTRRGAT